uniref:Scm polycomb group protein like 4 n=1 Tax=Cavia porcellus TaxID=10141 RepID=A0A286XJS9_CAVPO
MQALGVTGRKPGWPPLHPTPSNPFSASARPPPAVKIPKKRAELISGSHASCALSPPGSTPKPDLSSTPQDTATGPKLAAPQALTAVCLRRQHANTGPYLEGEKVRQLPEHLGPEQPAVVLQQSVQACTDCAHRQKRQGHNGELVS